MPDDTAYAVDTERAPRIRRRGPSPVELIDAVIARMEERGPRLNAFLVRARRPSAPRSHR